MFEKTFCSSPWFHIGVTYNGNFEPCRWAREATSADNISNRSLMQFYNSSQMKELRSQLLNGESPNQCSECYYQEKFGKLNGRLKQLNKSAVNTKNFALTMRSSPHHDNFLYSYNNNGEADLAPVDLQIDLGNTCNSACIMCHPHASSRLEKDYQKLSIIDSTLFKKFDSYEPWTKNQDTVERFVAELNDISNLKYVHFLGGETLYEPAFYKICDQLMLSESAAEVIVGTTTNGTIFDDRLEKYIATFKEFHLGISIESITELNDYIRWPGKIENILPNIKKFLDLRENYPGLYISLRITPNILSVYELDKLFVFMFENNVSAESCNILQDPDILRVELLPDDIRNTILTKFEYLIDYYDLSTTEMINVRRNDLIRQSISNLVLEYYNFFKNFESPSDDLQDKRINLIKFLKAFESLRNNNILDHLPEYEKFLRSYGY